MTTKRTDEAETKASHTPGPWEVNKVGRNFEILGDRHRGEGDAVDEPNPDSVVWLANVLGNATDGGIAEANARLIAAAPDLLKCLKGIADAEAGFGRPPFSERDGSRDASAQWIAYRRVQQTVLAVLADLQKAGL